jgi:hypothetical protein
MAGRLLGNRSIRECIGDDPHTYDLVSKNYQANKHLDDVRLKEPGVQKQPGWNKPGILFGVFGDQGIVDALMEINSDNSRHSTAVVIGFYILRELPKPL